MTKIYLKEDRGNRLKPGVTNSRYWILKSFAKNLAKTLEEPFAENKNILDYGCGNKPYKELFLKVFKEYVGADLKGNEDAEVIIKEDGTLPIEDNSFSCVLSTQVLEHVADPALYLKEANRILNPGCALILSTHGFWSYHPDPTDYWRWTSEGLKKIIEEAGFKIEKIYSVLSFPSISIQMWQNATSPKIPKLLRTIYCIILQTLMQIIDRIIGDKFSENAAVFIVVAKKK